MTITVALAADPPPKAALDDFTQQTGITVNWVNIDWDSLQTKISAAATAKTYFADATDVDWSRVGQLGKLGWFYPMGDYLDVNAMQSDMPQLASFTSDGRGTWGSRTTPRSWSRPTTRSSSTPPASPRSRRR